MHFFVNRVVVYQSLQVSGKYGVNKQGFLSTFWRLLATFGGLAQVGESKKLGFQTFVGTIADRAFVGTMTPKFSIFQPHEYLM